MIDAVKGFLETQGVRFTGKELGAGSLASVVEAEVDGCNRAVKISKRSIEQSEDTRHELERGPQIWQLTSQHPALVTFIKHFKVPVQGGSEHFLATVWELAERSLDTEVGRIARATLLDRLDCVASAIDFLNGRPTPVFHRDVKPQNILLFPGGDARLADLGSAKTAAGSALGMPGTIIGTPGICPPEQIDQQMCHPSCDRYALAVTYVIMSTGQLPIGGAWTQPRDMRDTIVQQKDWPAQEQNLRRLGFTESELNLLLAVLAPEPGRRPFRSAREWVAQFRQDGPATVDFGSSNQGRVDDGEFYRELIGRSIGVMSDQLPQRLLLTLPVVGLFRAKQLAYELKEGVNIVRLSLHQMRRALDHPDPTDNAWSVIKVGGYATICAKRDTLRDRLDECAAWPRYQELVNPIFQGLDQFAGNVLRIAQGYLPKPHSLPTEFNSKEFNPEPALTNYPVQAHHFGEEIRRVWPNVAKWLKGCETFYGEYCRLLQE